MFDSKRLRPVFRVSVFVPPRYLQQVIDSARRIEPLGDERYDGVHWIIEGAVERFRPLAGSNPAAGRVGELHSEDSVLLVFSIERDEQRLQRLLDEAIFPAHPWESPAVFVDESFQAVRLSSA